MNKTLFPLLSLLAVGIAVLACLAESNLALAQAPNSGVAAAAAAPLGATPSPTCGPGWSHVNSPSPERIRSILYDVAVISADNVWAVGQHSTTFGVDETLILHWDGSQWSLMPGPNVPYSGLYSISVVAPNDIWAVGYYNPDEFSVYQTLTVHWNGTSWSFVPSRSNPGHEEVLHGVGAVSANDVWAVGENADGPLIMRWNGSTWSTVPHPLQHGNTRRATGYIDSDRPNLYWDSLNAVGAISASDVWAVGALGDNSLAMHWDGTTWEAVNTPNPYSTVILNGISAISPSDIWAVGSTDFYFGQPRAVSIHWNGQTWSNVSVQSVPGNLVLNDITTLPTGDLWAVGYEVVDDYRTSTAILHRSGTQWTRVPSPNPSSPTVDELYGIVATAPGGAWAVGWWDGETMVDRYDTCGTPLPTPTTSPTSTIAASPSATPCSLSFTDVYPTDYFYEAVHYLYCHGAISGYGTVFLPYHLTTRGQLAKIVTLAEGWSTYTPSTPTFRDVPATHTFYLYIETAYHQGIISGYNCGTGCLEFRPEANVTRAQLCKIIVSAEQWTLYTPPTPTFRDVPATNPFYAYIETAYQHAVISGYACGAGCLEFRPASTATRGQICKIIYAAVSGLDAEKQR